MTKIVRRKNYKNTLQITAGSKKGFQVTVVDGNNKVVDLSNEAIFKTAKFNILEGDFTLIKSVTATYFDRPNGIMQFEIDNTIANNGNAGNWVGELEFLNEANPAVIVDQKYMNFNILQSN